MSACESSGQSRIVPVLVAGFMLVLCLLLASAVVAFQAIQSVERSTSTLMREQRASTRLTDDIQGEEDGLSAIFYAIVAEPGARSSPELLRRLDQVRARVQATTEAGLAAEAGKQWLDVRRAANALIGELRRMLTTAEAPSRELYVAHQRLVQALSELTSQNYHNATNAQRREAERIRSLVRDTLGLLAAALALAIPGAVLTIRAALRTLRTLEWQTRELARLTARNFSVQEETARRFSRELHDQFGQTLSAIEANLVAMRDSGQNSPRVADCLALVKDAIGNVRQISQLLRPSVLDDFGLDASLRWMAESFSQRTAIRVDYNSSFDARLSGGTETQLFRIAQEALTNIARHSDATRVRIDLSAARRKLLLTISDNGRGLEAQDSMSGTGLISMRARAREAGGTLAVRSARGQGVTIVVELPLESQTGYAAENQHPVGR